MEVLQEDLRVGAAVGTPEREEEVDNADVGSLLRSLATVRGDAESDGRRKDEVSRVRDVQGRAQGAQYRRCRDRIQGWMLSQSQDQRGRSGIALLTKEVAMRAG